MILIGSLLLGPAPSSELRSSSGDCSSCEVSSVADVTEGRALGNPVINTWGDMEFGLDKRKEYKKGLELKMYRYHTEQAWRKLSGRNGLRI